MPTQGFWLKTKKETFQKYLKDGQINLIYTNYTHLQISKVELTVAINLSKNSYSKPPGNKLNNSRTPSKTYCSISKILLIEKIFILPLLVILP